ncbi:MAG: ribokinase [Bacillota bacterium]|nr:ribokinase [Bacillota bacterium]
MVVIGSLIFDFVAFTQRMPEQGETVEGYAFGMYPGGKGANQAVQVGRLGGLCYMIGMVGNDFMGRTIIESLQSSNVNTDYIAQTESTHTGSCCIFVDASGQNRIVMVPQANHCFSCADLDRVEHVVAQCDIVLMQLELPLPVVEYAVCMAKRHDRIVILNPAPFREFRSEIVQQVDVITPNYTEAKGLAGLAAREPSLTELGARMRSIKKHGWTVVTLGSNGALVVTETDMVHVPAYRIEAVDETAAGDAFNGALAYALAAGKAPLEAVKYANAAGALAAMRRGAQPSIGTRREIDQLITEQGYLKEMTL